ncbi:MAG: anaerobic sulfatase maturase [Methanotrichaceae archaeon]|nr:anaerobic sulfatase maturase [Methanotrichaceae archaeon]
MIIPESPESWPTNAPSYFHVMAKPAGSRCNFNCKYCFFLSKNKLYPESNFRMADDVLEAYIKQVIESQRSPEVTIAWQGGEPTLMGLDFFQRSIELVRKYARPGITPNFIIQTNGALLDKEWCNFLRNNRFLVGLSMDGPRELHDAYRRDKGGSPTFDRVMRAARLMQRYHVDFNILCTVHAANVQHPLEVYRFFRDVIKTQFIQFIPIVERVTPELLDIANKGWDERQDRPLYTQQGDMVTDRSVNLDLWGKFLIAIFDEWVRRDVGKVFVQIFESTLASWMGLPASLCIFAETCGDGLALEHNGDLYSCDHFVEPNYYLGNILHKHLIDLVASEDQRAFGRAKSECLPRYCCECDVRFACNGECPRNRFSLTPDGEPGLNYLCSGYKAFFNHIDRPMRIMADLLRRRHYANEVMQILAAEERQL